MLEEAHDLYSAVVRRAEESGAKVNHEVNQDEPPEQGMVPLLVPATFIHSLGKRFNEKSVSGMQLRLYSNYPFKWRKDGGPRDDFQRDALRQLTDDPSQPVFEFTEQDGKPVVRYVTAWIMKPNCVACHNSREDSLKHDWQVGDVRGALEIVRPLENDVARAQAGLRTTFVLIVAVFALLLVLTILVLLRGRTLRSSG
jgi:hypothetical protein